jgi:hypothetical protein
LPKAGKTSSKDKSVTSSSTLKSSTSEILKCGNCDGHFPSVLMEAHMESCSDQSDRHLHQEHGIHHTKSSEGEFADEGNSSHKKHLRNLPPAVVIPKSGNAYMNDLNKQIEDNRIRKLREKEERENWERKKDEEIANYDPYGRPGGGAPIKAEDGSPIADIRYRSRMHDIMKVS